MEVFEIHFPQGMIAQSVASIVYYEGLNPTHSIDRLLPDGSMNLLLELDDKPQYTYDNQDLSIKEKYAKSWISGLHSDFISISSSGSSMMVIQFKPSGSYSILGIPAFELVNQVVDAELVLGSEIVRFRDHIQNTVGVWSKISQAEEWLTGQFKKLNLVSEAVVKYAIETTQLDPSSTNMHVIARKTGYSHQHFINLFKKYVGCTPKQYQRIVRFNHVLQEIDQLQQIDWARLSNDLGYFDQAHFIKDFKSFSGFSPKKYLAERGEYLNYVPMDETF